MFHFTKDHSAYNIKAEDYETKPLFVFSKESRLLNEFFLYVLEDLNTSQSLSALQFTSADPAFVKEMVERSSPTTLFKSNDGRIKRRISALCDDQNSSTLAMLEEIANEAFKIYMPVTRKTHG
jgi:hypothetical protein